ncbi:hypothetical protein MAR_030690 [Mya arenaria]|uniref:ADP ribosyltransferase domain-containing protein n=1 Tax=Mya arenaria TaxID=6604 RepID=A0ABY7F4X8_MYAAR|nr:hypothetical protein MAR_030690 [Mya arenaria]
MKCTVAQGGSYADNVRNLFVRHFNDKDNKCWKATKADQTTNDKDMAIALVNVYTQECKDYNNKTNASPFYKELNAKLRAQTKEQIWLDTEQLLNQGLGIIGIKTWDLLFRACKCDNIKQGHSFHVYSYWSTSLLPWVANDFLNDEAIFFKMLKTPRGADVSQYSKFSYEKEVLLQSNREFYVTEYVTDKQGIANKTKEVDGKLKWSEMLAFAVVTGDIPARGSRSAPKSGYCDCSHGTTSGASMPTSFLSALFFIAFTLV